jgi:formylglycine-generating enzyme required for sulfatase activity
MAQVFVSYSRKDISFVERLASDLKNAGLDVWYDVSSLGGGSRWRAEIETAIRGSQFVIVVLSPDSIASEWVEREFLFANNLKRKIIPLMYRFCELPLNYLDLNYIDVQGDKYQGEFPDLLRALTVDPTKSTLPAVKPRRPFFSWKNIVVVAGGLIFLSVILLLLSNTGILSSLSFGSTPTSTEVPVAEVPFPPSIDSNGAEMILIPADDFTMGVELDNALKECRKYRTDCQDNWFKDEVPSRVIYLDAFYIDKYEVTNGLYTVCEQAGVCQPPLQLNSSSRTDYYQDSQFANYPIIHVTWDMAKAYCEWRGARLPTEAEWEKAARGTNGSTYPWGNDFSGSDLNFCDINCSSPTSNKDYDDSYNDVAAANSYPSGVSPYGIFNMSGNVWEWVADWYKAYPGGDPTGSPYYEPEQTYRVIRGGAWDSSVDLIRTTNRDPRKPSDSGNNIGFRCAMDAIP